MFHCSQCGAQAPRWQGRCSACGAWSTLERVASGPGRRARPPPAAARPLAEFAATPVARRSTGFAELDRALGGGLVPGSTVLVGGEPGIGKSTLLLALCARSGGRTLYVAGEESPEQVALRATRLGLETGGLLVLDSTDTGAVAAAVRELRPAVCVTDSVQTLRTPDVAGAPGGPAQVRAAADVLVPVARETGVALLLVGQVTKVGGLAGPRFLEHAVDAVLLFEGDRHTSLRVLRPVKNRYGPTDEIGLFEMRDDGLHEVRNASDHLLSRRETGPGAVVACIVEGRRPLCVEVQALLVKGGAHGFRRRGQGLDPRRIELLVGVVQALHFGDLDKQDVLVNVVGGLTVHDTAIDLAVTAAVLGAAQGLEVDPAAVLVGEVGLRGEVRAVPRGLERLKEARVMGFRRAFAPLGTPRLDGLEVTEVRRIDEVFPPEGPGPGPPWGAAAQ